jgi:hypothetical protein
MATVRARRAAGTLGEARIDGRGRLRIRFAERKGQPAGPAQYLRQNEASELMVAQRSRE